MIIHRFPPGLRSIVSGVGAVRDQLARALSDAGATKPMIVCGQVVGATSLVPQVEDAAQATCSVYRGSRPHTPDDTIDTGAAFAREHAADTLIALGGSSAVDCAKGIAVLLAAGKHSMAELVPGEFGALSGAADTGPTATPVPVICVPTTLSMAEFQPFFGARSARMRRKHPYLEAGRVQRTVFLDGEIAVETPGHLWAETGVKCLDDAIMRYCNAAPDRAADAVLEHAIGELFGLLPRSSAGPADPDTRQRVLHAAWLTGYPVPRAVVAARQPWFSTTARHALGGAIELAHGVGSCIALVPALRFHLATTGGRQRQLASALAVPDLVDATAALLGSLGVPTRLDSALTQEQTDSILANIEHEAPGLATRQQLIELLRDCQAGW